MRAVRTPGCAVFVVNDTDDRSADVIAQWSRRSRISALVVEVAFSASIRNAPHARRLALDIAARAVPHGILFTTDADTTVGEAWVERGIQSVAAGSDLVCEDVQLDEQELSALPRQVREVGDTGPSAVRASWRRVRRVPAWPSPLRHICRWAVCRCLRWARIARYTIWWSAPASSSKR